ncbi:MAG: sulfatase-like hydrolase/transferase [Oceanipulchritudo sp.]
MSKTNKQPHILLITTDQQRYDALGINGNRILETPNLDGLAARGLNFSRCYITCPVCIPARRTLLSGLHPNTHGLKHYEDGLEFDPPFTLPGILRGAGYQTQLVGKLHMHPMGKRYGFDHMVLSETPNWRPTSTWQHRNDYARWLREQGVLDHPHFHGISGNGRAVYPWPMQERLHHNNWLAREAAQFLTEDRDPTSPFFLHLSFTHPHPPLVPTRSYLERYERKEMPGPTLGDWAPKDGETIGIPLDSACGPFDPDIIKRAQAGYYALINHIDDCVAHVLERWMEYGNPRRNEPLYILFSSDHGEMLGDHHLFRKSLAYEGSTHVPFFISGFNVDLERGESDALCCWEDILPTIAELAGVEVPGPVDGHSLAPAAKGASLPQRDSVYGLCGKNHFVVADNYKYIWHAATGEEQVFDLKADPMEKQDLSSDEQILDRLRHFMRSHLDAEDRTNHADGPLLPCRNAPPNSLFGDGSAGPPPT